MVRISHQTFATTKENFQINYFSRADIYGDRLEGRIYVVSTLIANGSIVNHFNHADVDKRL